ncbi:MAG: hypothetical protein SGILL_000767 [Bacillariaceae sp.]
MTSPVKRLDESIGEDASGAVTKSSPYSDDAFHKDVLTDATACELLDTLKAHDDSTSINTWSSETSIHLSSTKSSCASCASTQGDVSTCTEGESAQALEEALLNALQPESEHTSLFPSELIVPYPDESGHSQKHPMPWDTSSSDGTSSSSFSPLPKHTMSAGAQSETTKATTAPTDIQPLIPRRRGSNDVLSDDGDNSGEDSNGSNQSLDEESGEALALDLQAFLMLKLPFIVTSKLNANEWNQVCSEMVHFTKINGLSVCKDDRIQEGTNDKPLPKDEIEDDAEDNVDAQEAGDDSCSVVSELTGATGLIEWNYESARHIEVEPLDDSSALVSPISQSDKLLREARLHASARSWHEGSESQNAAPKMPMRRGRYPIGRRKSEPRSPNSVKRPFTRSSSLPSVISSVNRPSVSFDTVQVRHYEPVLDLNPATSCGPSVGIGWNYVVDSPRKVSDLEEEKDCQGRRKLSEIVIPRHVREQNLRECGYTPKQIAKAVRMNLKAKSRRLQTIHNYKIDQIVERSSRKVRRLFNPSRKQSQVQETAEF